MAACLEGSLNVGGKERERERTTAADRIERGFMVGSR